MQILCSQRGWTECTKLFLDLRRFVGAIWPYRECLLSVVCFSLSLWEMVLLLIEGAQYPRVGRDSRL